MIHYYDCPIIAAYMAKHFGVKYQKKNWDEENTLVNFEPCDYDDFRICDRDDLLYIAPESLPIFKPIVGDLCRIQWLDKSISFREIDHADFLPEAALDRDIRIPLQIIQRNKIPFFTPKTEE